MSDDAATWQFSEGDRVRVRASGRTGRVIRQFVSRASRPLYDLEFDSPAQTGSAAAAEEGDQTTFGEDELEKLY